MASHETEEDEFFDALDQSPQPKDKSPQPKDKPSQLTDRSPQPDISAIEETTKSLSNSQVVAAAANLNQQPQKTSKLKRLKSWFSAAMGGDDRHEYVKENITK